MPNVEESDLLVEGTQRRPGRKLSVVYMRPQFRETSSMVVTRRRASREMQVKRKRMRDGPSMTNVKIIQGASTASQSSPQEEEGSVFAPAVFKGAKGIRFEGAVVGEGALSAVAGNMYIGYMPEANSPSGRDATPKKYLPSVLEDAEDVVFGPGTQVLKGGLGAIAGNMVISEPVETMPNRYPPNVVNDEEDTVEDTEDVVDDDQQS